MEEEFESRKIEPNSEPRGVKSRSFQRLGFGFFSQKPALKTCILCFRWTHVTVSFISLRRGYQCTCLSLKQLCTYSFKYNELHIESDLTYSCFNCVQEVLLFSDQEFQRNNCICGWLMR